MNVAAATPFAKMAGQYACFDGDAKIHHYPDYAVLTIVDSSTQPRILYINRTAAEILEECNGLTEVGAIAERFRTVHQADRTRVETSVERLLNEGLSGGYLRLSESPVRQRMVRTGSDSYYMPQKLSLEMTSRCNQKCLHCYGNFDNHDETFLNLRELQEITGRLIAGGMKVLTVTGGEPFLYRDIAAYLDWVLPRMELIGIISNGTCIPEEVFDILGAHKHKVVFQATINGRREYHDRFAGLPGSFDKVVATIRNLVEREVKVRLAMNVTSENLGDIAFVAELAHTLGIAIMSASVPHNIGREKARRTHDSLFVDRDPDDNLDLISLMAQHLSKAKEKYPRLFRKPIDAKEVLAIAKGDPGPEGVFGGKPFTCGAGQRSIHVSANGDVHLCAIARACGFPRLGNLRNNTLDEIMSAPVARAAGTLAAPVGPFCDLACRHFVFCGGCIVRGFTRYRMDESNCTWGKHFFGGSECQALIEVSDKGD